MQLTSQSQWMKAQKHADVMAPNGHFDVIQSSDETSIFLSLGTDGILWATKEVQSTSVGWDRADLSSGLSASFANARVTAKAFAVSQNTVNGKWSLVLAAAINGTDHLFVSQDNDYSAHNAAATVTWTDVPFDASGQTSKKIQIADVFIINVPQIGSTCVVDIWRTPGTNNSLDRYYITPGNTPQWNQHLLAIDLDAGSISSVLGQRARDRVAGMYTFGMIDGVEELIYAPLYNAFRPDSAPSPVRLALPGGSTCITSTMDHAGHTSLFVAHAGGLSVYPANAQTDGAVAIPCINSALVASASQLQAMTCGSITSIWGRNPQGNLFYATCPTGSEAAILSWSAPIVLLTSIEQFAFYNGMSTNSHTLFAHIDGQKIVELDQDPVTTIWRQRNIMLPSTDMNDMVEFDSYTTRLGVTDDYRLPQPNVEVSLTSVSPVPVYINDTYYVLNTRTPVIVKTDGTGGVAIVQQTDSFAAVCYNVSLAGSTSLIDPTAGVVQRLAAIQNGADLAAVHVEDEAGNTKSLLASSVNDDDRDAGAQAIKQFCEVGTGLPADGTAVKAQSAAPQSLSSTAGTHVLTLSADSSTQRLRSTKNETVSTPEKSTWVKIGDFFKMLGNELLTGLRSVVVRIVDGVYHVFAKIGDVVYHALLDCKAAIAHALNWVFTQLKVLWDDLVAWLGFIFGWKDIVRTHQVMKNLVKQYVRKSFASIETMEEKISTMFEGLEGRLNALTDVTDPGIKVGSYTASKDPDDGSSSPQCHWGINHVKSNMSNARTVETDNSTSVLGSLEAVLKDLEALAENELNFAETMINQIRTQIVDQYHDLTPLQVSKRLIGIVSDLLLKSAKNILVKVLDIIKSLTEAAFNILDAPIDIPILGPLYKQITSSDPSVLDIVVLVMAIPATIMYKIAAREAPFPDNATTATMINATDFQTFKDIVHRESSSSTGPLIHAKMNQSRAAVAVTAPVAAATASTDAGTTPASSTAPSTGDWTATYRVFNIIGRFFSAVNAGLQAPIEQFNLELEKDESGKLIPLSTPWQITEAISTILGLLPNIILSFDQTGTWEAIMSQVVADMGILVTIVGKTPLLKDNTIWKENVSPALTIVLQMANLAPSIGNFVMLGDKRKASDSVGLTATSFARIANISYASAKILYPKGGTAKIVGVGVLIVGQNSGLLNGCLTISTAGMICANK